jgi:phytanoyl-CoA dioxygenase PhyH
MSANPLMAQSASNRRPSVLSEDEVAAYNRDGFVVPRYRLPEADLARLRAICEKLLSDHPNIHNVPITNPHLPHYSVQKLKTEGAPWLAAATKPELLDMVEQAIGPDIVIFQTALFHKKAVTGGRAPYHRDGKYYPIKPLVATNIWIAVTPSTVENGCLRIIPGSHAKKEAGEHIWTDGKGGELFRIQLADGEYNEADAVPVELEPGQMVLFDVYSIHGGEPNTSGRQRTGFSIRYFPASSYWDHANPMNNAETSEYTDNSKRPLILVRGKDSSGRNDFSVGHVKPNGGFAPA